MGSGRLAMKSKLPQSWGSLLQLSSVGFVLAFCVGLGAWGGLWLDRRWGTHPWMTALGVILGSVAGFVELLREVSKSTPKDE